MTSTPAPSRKTLTGLDYRIEAAVGRTVNVLWNQHADGLLDAPHTMLAEAHRALAQAETNVSFYRVQLARLASGEFPVNAHLFDRIARTVSLLEKAADERDTKLANVLEALRPIEAAAHAQDPQQVSTADFAALLAITQGAKLQEHLLTQRLEVVTPSSTYISSGQLRRLEEAGLVHRDSSHPLHAGQPITLTDAGQAVLSTPPPTSRPGTKPVPAPTAAPAPPRTHR